MSVSASNFSFVCDLVRRRAAIVLEPGKEYLVDARLGSVVNDFGFASIDALVDHVRADENDARAQKIAREIVDALTTNETSFFRDVHPFEALKTKVIPDLVAARASSRKLRIWCAAASTGQEPFSIAMVIREHFPQLASWDVQIIATDINRAVLARARSGAFRQLEVNRGLPASMLVKYFHKSGLDWQIKDSIRDMVSFRELNLLDSWPLFGAYDLVFLRNVLIYFDVPTKKRILNRVRETMAPDGVLFLGGAETTLNIDDEFVSERLPAAGMIYRRRNGVLRSGAAASTPL